MASRPIVIIGGSAAGLEAAIQLDRRLDHEVTTPIYLIDPSPYYTFLPHTVELLRSRSPRVVNIPFSTLLEGTRVQHVQAHVTHVDVEHSTVTTEHKRFRYGDLVIAVENQPWPQDAKNHEYGALLTCNSAEEVLEVRGQIIEQLKSSPKQSAEVFVIGGGVKGVEFVAGLCDFMRQELSPGMRRERKLVLTLAETGDRLLPGYPAEVAAAVSKFLRKRGVTIKYNAALSATEIKQKLKQSTSRKQIVVWAVGTRAHPLVTGIKGVPHDHSGRIHVESTLQARGYDHVWVAGDSAALGSTGWEMAIAQGRHVAKEIIAQRHGGRVTAFVPRKVNQYVQLSHHYGISVSGNQVHEGAFPALLKRWQAFRYVSSILSVTQAWRVWWQPGVITHDAGLVCYQPFTDKEGV